MFPVPSIVPLNTITLVGPRVSFLLSENTIPVRTWRVVGNGKMRVLPLCRDGVGA